MRRTIALVASALLYLTACGAPPAGDGSTPSAPGAAGTVTVTDDLGREVTVRKKPERVAALIGSFADIWYLAGGIDSLVAAADDTWTSFDLPLGGDVVDLGAVKHIALEPIIACDPDLILASTNTAADLDLLPTFEELGFPALYLHVDRFDEYLHMLDLCTRITGEEERYVLYGSDVQARVDAAVAMQDGSAPSVLYVRASGSSCKAKGSEGNVLGEMLRDLGCRNIADGDSRLLEDLSMEAILEAEPDHIFLVYQGSDPTDAQALLDEMLLSDPAWAGLRAVREGRCHVMDHRLYNLKPNAQWGTAYEELAQILYGDAGT